MNNTNECDDENINEDRPYSEITLELEELFEDDPEERIIFKLGNYLVIERDFFAPIPEKGLPELPEINLTFNIDNAIKLRDFLNFALSEKSAKPIT